MELEERDLFEPKLNRIDEVFYCIYLLIFKIKIFKYYLGN